MYSYTIYDIGWGSELEILFEFIFFIVTFLVGMYAYKVSKFSGNSQARYFSFSFILISLSYLTQFAFNFLILAQLVNPLNLNKILNLFFFDLFGLTIHIFLMTSGIILLAFTTLKVEKTRMLLMLAVLTFVSLYFSRNRLQMFFLLTSVYLVFIAYHYLQNYFQKKSRHTLLIAIGFILLFAGRSHFLFSQTGPFFYHAGHLLELLSYSCLLANFWILKKKLA